MNRLSLFSASAGTPSVPSSSLLPDDPSVLLTTAGMQQFKRYFTGELNAAGDFGSRRAVSVQKCFRTSDIDEVGDETHLTFLKCSAIFLSGRLKATTRGSSARAAISNARRFSGLMNLRPAFWGISPNGLTVSVFEGDQDVPFDDDSYRIWNEEVEFPKTG